MDQGAPADIVASLHGLARRGDFAQLESQARSALGMFPSDGVIWKLLGQSLRALGREDAGVWQRAAALLPDDPEVIHRLGDVSRAAGNFQLAEHCYGRLIDLKQGVAGAHVNRGMVRIQAGRLDAAEADYCNALKIDQNLIEARYNLALLLRQQSRFDEAGAHFAELIRRRPDFAEAFNGMGVCHQASGRWLDAELSFRQAILLRPDYIGPLAGLARLLSWRGVKQEACVIYRRLRELRPDSFEVQQELAGVEADLGNLSDAEVAYRSALGLAPASADAMCGLATVIFRLGRESEADLYFNQALRIRPDYPYLHFRKAQLLLDLGRDEEALRQFAITHRGQDDWRHTLTRLSTPWVVLDGLVRGKSSRRGSARSAMAAMPVANLRGVASKNRSGHGIPVIRDAALPAGAARPLKVVLIYPPPWQIPDDGESADALPFGPPRQPDENEPFDSDFFTLPYGLLTIAAEARRAGHVVEVFNLSAAAWSSVKAIVRDHPADVYGISTFTSNRRGLAAVAKLVKAEHPGAYVTCGGPFVTAVPRETLQYFADVDSVVVGEGELTFIELLGAIAANRAPDNIDGLVWRQGRDVVVGPSRQRIRDLDVLASPFDHFTSHIVMTSRGCPSSCSFCGSSVTWGKKLRFHSVDACIDTFKKALARLPVPFLVIKDDTFTAHRRRALAICDRIIDSGMNFLWSCDTRVDSLDEELLLKMRQAGCQRISLGIESGAQEILDSIHKDSTPAAALEITRLARSVGMHVRYYMIVGNRGETPETVQAGIKLIQAAKPAHSMFYPLSFSPGTEEWEILCKISGVTSDVFFLNDFRDLGVAYQRRKDWGRLLNQIQCEIGCYGFELTVEECEAVALRLPGVSSVLLDLAKRYRDAGRLDEAEQTLDRVAALNFPIPGILDNQRACAALARGNVDQALGHLDHAVQRLGHWRLLDNRRKLRLWADSPVDVRGAPPVLFDSTQGYAFHYYPANDRLVAGGSVT